MAADDYTVDRNPLLRPVLARKALRPIARSAYDHDCHATKPGVLPWLLVLALLALAVLSLLAASQRIGPPGWLEWASGRTECVLLVAAALLALFWIVGWEARSTPRGILVGLGSRNVCSLSIAQAVAWSALFVAVTLASVLVVAVPQAVDSLGTVQAGLGVGAAAGSVLALSGKADDSRKPDFERAVERTAAMAVRRAPKPYVRDLVAAAGKEDDASKARGEAPDIADLVAAAKAAQQKAQKSRTADSSQESVAAVAGVVRRIANDDKRAVKVLSRVAQGGYLDDAINLLGLNPAKHGALRDDLKSLLAAMPDDLQAYVAHALDDETMRRGVLYCNGCPCEGRLKDMFQGDEVGNTYQFDVNKLQFLALTLLAMGVYLAVAVQRLEQPFGLTAYPGGVLATLGLSSAAYVGVKLPTQTRLEA